jgi:lactoylglutathione lyase
MTFDQSNAVKHTVVLSPDIHPIELDMLSVTASPRVLMSIASHPRTTATTLARLATSKNSDVRAAVGENGNTPDAILHRLAADPSADVRYSLAENHNLPVGVLRVLLKDENPYVSARAQRTLHRLLPNLIPAPSEEVAPAQSASSVYACA